MNKYFIDDDMGLSVNQIAMQKKNNFYFYMAFSFIYDDVVRKNKDIGGELRGAMLSGRLPKKDLLTGINSNHMAEKIKFLVLALSDPNHKENIEIFKSSFFYNNVLKCLTMGFSVDSDNKWINFKRTANFESSFVGKNSYDIALICQREDISSPLGLDFTKLIDTIIKTDENGNYYLDGSMSVEDEVEVAEAVELQLKAFQTNERFCRNCINPKSSYLDGDYNEIY